MNPLITNFLNGTLHSITLQLDPVLLTTSKTIINTKTDTTIADGRGSIYSFISPIPEVTHELLEVTDITGNKLIQGKDFKIELREGNNYWLFVRELFKSNIALKLYLTKPTAVTGNLKDLKDIKLFEDYSKDNVFDLWVNGVKSLHMPSNKVLTEGTFRYTTRTNCTKRSVSRIETLEEGTYNDIEYLIIDTMDDSLTTKLDTDLELLIGTTIVPVPTNSYYIIDNDAIMISRAFYVSAIKRFDKVDTVSLILYYDDNKSFNVPKTYSVNKSNTTLEDRVKNSDRFSVHNLHPLLIQKVLKNVVRHNIHLNDFREPMGVNTFNDGVKYAEATEEDRKRDNLLLSVPMDNLIDMGIVYIWKCSYPIRHNNYLVRTSKGYLTEGVDYFKSGLDILIPKHNITDKLYIIIRPQIPAVTQLGIVSADYYNSLTKFEKKALEGVVVAYNGERYSITELDVVDDLVSLELPVFNLYDHIPETYDYSKVLLPEPKHTINIDLREYLGYELVVFLEEYSKMQPVDFKQIN